MKRFLVFLYGTVVYLFFLGVFLYAIGFVGNIWVPKSIDSGDSYPVPISLLINALVLGLFAVQHTIMARPAFKNFITRIIPQAAERSTFVLTTNLVFLLLFIQWRPLSDTVWFVESAAGSLVLNILFWAGWGTVLVSTFLIDHFDLFGLRQVTFYLLKKDYYPPKFRETSLYKYVRHPIMLGFLVAFWATPHMTVGHLFFSILTSGYILVGLTFEERDLIKHHGETYLRYARRVPRLIPFLKFGNSGAGTRPDLKEDKAAG